MANRHRTAVIGMGVRGKIHLHGLSYNAENFEIVGICDLSSERLDAAGEAFGVDKDKRFIDAREMLHKTRPDVLVIATMPQNRLSLVQLAANARVRGLMLEKPMARGFAEAAAIKRVCLEAGIKVSVCHQHKYLRSFDQMREIIEREKLGEIQEIHASCRPHAFQLGTHYIDYMLWANRGIKASAVTGHVHGNFYLNDSHPSPDYVLGRIVFANGVRGLLECGYFSRRRAHYAGGFSSEGGEEAYWTDDRLTIYGTKGYAWAECSGRYGYCTVDTAPEIASGDFGGFFEHEQFLAQERYTADFARWLNGAEGFSCDIAAAFHGFEILEAIYQSALEHNRIDLPIELNCNKRTEQKLKKVLHQVEYREL